VEDPVYGEMSLGTTGEKVSYLLTWENAAALWRDFAADGALKSFERDKSKPTSPGQTTNAALVTEVTVPPRAEVTVPFLLTWRFPNYHFQGKLVGNHYATTWADSREAMIELVKELPRLQEETERYRKATYETTLPYWLTDCITSQTSTIRSEVCIWLG